MNLTDPTLGHTEHPTDLGQGEAFVVVERQHDLLSLTHAVHRIGQRLAHLDSFVDTAGTILTIGEGVTERHRVSAAAEHLVERHQTETADLVVDVRELLIAHAEFGCDLFVARCSMELRLELGHGSFDRLRLRSHRAWHPIDRAKLVEDSTLDARDRIGLELEATFEVELRNCVDQPEHAVTDEVSLVDVLWQTRSDARGHELDQWGVIHDQLIAIRLLVCVFVPLPDCCQIGFGFDTRHVSRQGVWTSRCRCAASGHTRKQSLPLSVGT